jgi:hypothetical protein
MFGRMFGACLAACFGAILRAHFSLRAAWTAKSVVASGRRAHHPAIRPRAFRRRRSSHRLLAEIVVALAATQSPALASPHVRIRGTAHLDAHATYSHGSLRVEGTLADDVNAPLAEESVSASLSATGPGGEALRLEPCSRDAASRVARSTDGLSSARTDERGRFCVVTAMALPKRCVARFAWDGTPWFEGATLELAVDPSLASIELRFDPEPALIALEQEPFGLDAIAAFADKAAAASPSGLTLVLTTEVGTELGRGTTDTSGHVRFVLVPARMGPPGKGELRVTFGGDATTGRASHLAEIERSARVTLSVPTAHGQTLPQGTPDANLSFAVLAATSAGEPVNSGSIEARVEGKPVGAATIESGRAELLLRFSAEEERVSEIHLRYEASAPWYESGDDLILHLPVVATSGWRRAPLLVAGLAVVVWLALGRTARFPSVRTPGLRGPVLPSTHARVTVVRAGQDSGAGWTGHVLDAHDATPLRGAEVAIVRPGFGESDALARATADEAGRFELRCDALREGDRLEVSARLHATLRQPVPAFGEIEIALVLRRRALLDRFVAWARERGAPFDTAREPTPGQVARAAIGDRSTARWARKVERAAFGPEEVDADVERDLEEGAPSSSIGSVEHLEKEVDDTPD